MSPKDTFGIPKDVEKRFGYKSQKIHIAPTDIWQLNNHPNAWLRQVQGTECIYYRAIGSAESLMAKAEELGQAWMKGVASDLVKKILRERPT